jgi:hypothetical protein
LVVTKQKKELAMPFLKRSRTPSRLLPADLGRLLAEYGYFEFDASVAPTPSDQTLKLMEFANFNDALRAQPETAINEIREAAVQTGGWALYGAPKFIDAFIPSQSGTPTYEFLNDERLRYLHSLQLPDAPNGLNYSDRERWTKLFPS